MENEISINELTKSVNDLIAAEHADEEEQKRGNEPHAVFDYIMNLRNQWLEPPEPKQEKRWIQEFKPITNFMHEIRYSQMIRDWFGCRGVKIRDIRHTASLLGGEEPHLAHGTYLQLEHGEHVVLTPCW